MIGGTRAIGYVRVSSQEQGESGLGLEAQREAIRNEAERRGWELSGIHEEVKSAAKASNRPVLQEVLSGLGRGDTLVVARLDRLTRSLLDFAAVVEQARRRGWSLVVVDQGFDLETPSGRAMAGMLAVFAEWERGMISLRTSAALQAKMEEGWRPYRPQPRIPVAVRRKIVRLHRAGVSQRKIAERLNADGIPAVGKRWHRGTIIRILQAAS